jgi:hypothetical protein
MAGEVHIFDFISPTLDKSANWASRQDVLSRLLSVKVNIMFLCTTCACDQINQNPSVRGKRANIVKRNPFCCELRKSWRLSATAVAIIERTPMIGSR